ncbi:MAG TPA: C25 family cysteine peptidase [Thermoanaerobaculia bacterium]|nr:C25 family cysteine peptidase [Thermoanaerobaculia bacterium]
MTATVPAHSGSTGSTSPLTPQANDGGTANGDFLSSDAPGLNTFYRYFIEVPPGISRLVVEIFDADIGAGGANEDTAGRDRDRNGYDSAVNYSLLDPSGTARTTRFTTGNNAAPAGADNAWLALYNISGNSVADNFGTNAFSNNDGTNNWSADWIETDGGGAGVGAGAVRVTGGELRLQDGVSGTPSAARQADLLGSPGLDLVVAYLTFDYRTSNNLEDSDEILVQVSNNGGGAWTTLETFTNDSSGSRSYDITAFIANNTQIRFVLSGANNSYSSSDEFFFVDNVRITDGAKTAGHWELRVDMSSSVTSGDDINAIGIRAHDGTSGSGGTELNVYYDSHNQHGVNPPNSGTQSREYDFYPYLTSGCSASENDFDHDSNSGTVGSIGLSSRTGTYTQSIASASLSTNNDWERNSFSGWTTDQLATGYGIWKADLTITSYVVSGTPNGNYANLYFGNYQAAANPPTANPTANTFRVYLPNDAGAAPVEPYVEQLLTFKSGTNPVPVGQTARYTVTVRVVNPGVQAITFSTPSNIVTARIPGSGAVYAGSPLVSQGTVVSQPSVGGTGDITWNPGTLAAGATAALAYEVNVSPTVAGQRILVTATPASGNGTRARYVDGTGNTTQARATYLFGPLCELAVTQGLLTEAVVSAFEAYADGGAVVLEWQTASEAGTLGFELYRFDPAARSWTRLNQDLLLGLLHTPQGGTYRFVDEGADPRRTARYRLVEVEVDGTRRVHGPFIPKVDWERSRQKAAMTAAFDRAAHPATREALVEDLPVETAAAKARGSARAIHISVREPGLYSVTSTDIASLLGIPLEEAEKLVGKGKLSLSRAGTPVAWFPDERERKRAVGLFFYGEGIDSLYTLDNVYRLEEGQGLQMAPAAVPGTAAAAGASFTATVRAEKDLLPATAIQPDPESDYWFWDFLAAGDPASGTKTYALDVPAVSSVPGQAALKVRLHGASATGVVGEHHATIRLNGTAIGEMQWQGIAPREATFPFGQELLLAAGNQVQIEAVLDSGTPHSVFYVDAFELTYNRLYQAAGDALAFEAGGNAQVAVSGFSTPQVRLLEVSNPARPRWVTGATVASGATPAEGYRLSFAPAAGGRYLAAAPGGLKVPVLRPWQDAGLRSRSNEAEYLVIAPAALQGAAERLAALRRGQGLRAMTVDLQAVMDEFNSGRPSPHALRDFLAYARTSWSTPPRYVVLAGAGTLDYRDLLGYGGNLVPPLMVQSEGGLFASDNRLADGNGDGMPEMAIGRIPVLNAAELDAYIDKITAYESGAGAPGAGNEWAGKALLLADTTDRGADFAESSERIAGLLSPDYTADRIYLSATPVAEARGQLLGKIQSGVSLINYLGHGGLDRLSSSGLLANSDAPGLANGDRLPVLTAMTCAVNRFAVPGVPPLGEMLVRNPNGGAAAVWGPSGLSFHGEAVLLAERFYHQTANPGTARLGDMILRSLMEFQASGGDASMLDIYNLLGDPALRLRRAGPPPANTPSGSGE